MVIVVDTSAIVAMLLGEQDAPLYGRVLSAADEVRMSAVTDYELRIVLGQYGSAKIDSYDDLIKETGMMLVDFDKAQSRLSHEAYCLWGKGYHPAGLNLGDCAAYALAKSLDAPLLFKGNDFARTDIRCAL
jgi:ribonuclease VapC